jgi:hypothetical protein
MVGNGRHPGFFSRSRISLRSCGLLPCSKRIPMCSTQRIGSCETGGRLIMPLIKRWSIGVSVFAVVVGVLLLADTYLSRQSSSFRVAEIKPTPVIETKLSGERTIYQTYHVSVAGYPLAADADMYAYAERIFSDQVRDMADQEGKSQIWFTFYLERVVINGQEKIRTFRIIYANEGNGWHRLEPTIPKMDSA